MVKFLTFLKQKVPLKRGYSLIGRETYFQQLAKERVLEALRQAVGEVELLKWQGSSQSLGELLDELQTESLFGTPKVVWVSDEKVFGKNSLERLEAFLQGDFSSSALMVALPKLDGRSKLAKMLKKHTLWVECDPLYHKPPPWKPNLPPHETDLCKWVVWECRRRQLKISPEDAYIFIHRLGNDPGAICGSIEAFVTFHGTGRAVRGEDIAAFLGLSRKSSGFEFTDHLVACRFGEAWECLEDILREGLEDQRGQRILEGGAIASILLALLFRKFHTLWLAQCLLQEGKNAIEAANQLGVPKFLFSSFRQELQQTSREELEKVLEILWAEERALKSGRKSVEEVLWDLTWQICQRRSFLEVTQV